MESDRKPRQLVTMPHNTDAEMALLGTLLHHGHLFDETIEKRLGPDDFWEPRHQTIFRAMQEAHKENRLTDFVSVSDQLTRRGDMEYAGGAGYLVEIMDASDVTKETPFKQLIDLV